MHAAAHTAATSGGLRANDPKSFELREHHARPRSGGRNLELADWRWTPLITKLPRKTSHVVKVQLAGYQPFEATLTRSVSGWVWGNVVFGGIIGLVVDAASGGLYKLTPEQITATMAAGNLMTSQEKGDGIFVAVVLKPQSDWIKVAQLQR